MTFVDLHAQHDWIPGEINATIIARYTNVECSARIKLLLSTHPLLSQEQD
jgi:hypothetical protein